MSAIGCSAGCYSISKVLLFREAYIKRIHNPALEVLRA